MADLSENHFSKMAALLTVFVSLSTFFVLETLAFEGPWQLPRRTSQLSSRSRRDWMMDIGMIPTLTFVDAVIAEDRQAAISIEMKRFVDPLFALSLPKSFYALRRTRKGDLPDSKTGKGRRGSSIFTAGNMAKAEVIAVEVRNLG